MQPDDGCIGTPKAEGTYGEYFQGSHRWHLSRAGA